MIMTPRLLTAAIGALALSASLFLSTGCKPKNQPAPFTAELTELPGVQAVYTLRHPKLINAELDKLMTEVPEAALARMFLGGLSAYGYPEFSEIAPGSNIGVALLEIDGETVLSDSPTLIGFVKLKADGKIWTALQQAGLTLEQRGEWTWVAKDPAAFDKLADASAVTAHISRPQDEELRVWARFTPALLDALKSRVIPALETKLADRSAEERQAIVAYADVLWGYVAQIHSGGGGLDLNDQGISLADSGQLLPDSELGTLFRHAPGPDPKIARSVPDDGLLTMVARQNAAASAKFFGDFLDRLIAVDFAPGAKALNTIKPSFLNLLNSGDGGAVLTMNMVMAKGEELPELDMFAVYSGDYTPEAVADYYRNSAVITEQFTNAFLTGISAAMPMAPASTFTASLNEDALTIDGVRFGALTTTTTTGDAEPVPTVQYYGVANGSYIIATSEDSLRAKLPAVLAKKAVANPVQIAFAGDEIAVGTIQGARIVDMVVEALQLDLSDADVQAQITGFKDGYAAAGAPRLTLSASQARAKMAISIPYKFISQSVRLSQLAVGAAAAKAAQETETEE